MIELYGFRLGHPGHVGRNDFARDEMSCAGYCNTNIDSCVYIHSNHPTELEPQIQMRPHLPQDINTDGAVNEEDLLELIHGLASDQIGYDINNQGEQDYRGLFFFDLLWDEKVNPL